MTAMRTKVEAEIAELLRKESFPIPKNLQNLLGKEMAKELNFEEDSSFLVTHTFTPEYTRMLLTFAVEFVSEEGSSETYCCIFYYKKNDDSNWWFLEEKFRLKGTPAIRVLKGIAAGGEVALNEGMIILDVLEAKEVLIWKEEE